MSMTMSGRNKKFNTNYVVIISLQYALYNVELFRAHDLQRNQGVFQELIIRVTYRSSGQDLTDGEVISIHRINIYAWCKEDRCATDIFRSGGTVCDNHIIYPTRRRWLDAVRFRFVERLRALISRCSTLNFRKKFEFFELEKRKPSCITLCRSYHFSHERVELGAYSSWTDTPAPPPHSWFTINLTTDSSLVQLTSANNGTKS